MTSSQASGRSPLPTWWTSRNLSNSARPKCGLRRRIHMAPTLSKTILRALRWISITSSQFEMRPSRFRSCTTIGIPMSQPRSPHRRGRFPPARDRSVSGQKTLICRRVSATFLLCIQTSRARCGQRSWWVCRRRNPRTRLIVRTGRPSDLDWRHLTCTSLISRKRTDSTY